MNNSHISFIRHKTLVLNKRHLHNKYVANVPFIQCVYLIKAKMRKLTTYHLLNLSIKNGYYLKLIKKKIINPTFQTRSSPNSHPLESKTGVIRTISTSLDVCTSPFDPCTLVWCRIRYDSFAKVLLHSEHSNLRPACVLIWFSNKLWDVNDALQWLHITGWSAETCDHLQCTLYL